MELYRNAQKTLVLVGCLAFIAASANAAMFTGTLSTADGTLVATGGWANGSTLSYTVYDVNPLVWHYSYTLTVPSNAQGGGISHFVLEVTENFLYADIFNATWAVDDIEIGPMAVQSGNPNMPENIPWAIKFDDSPDVRTLTISFDSNHVPEIGDFYAKGGLSNSVWNSGFTSPDDDPQEYLYNNPASHGHVVVPDGYVPEPATLALLGLGGVTLLARRKK